MVILTRDEGRSTPEYFVLCPVAVSSARAAWAPTRRQCFCRYLLYHTYHLTPPLPPQCTPQRLMWLHTYSCQTHLFTRVRRRSVLGSPNTRTCIVLAGFAPKLPLIH